MGRFVTGRHRRSKRLRRFARTILLHSSYAHLPELCQRQRKRRKNLPIKRTDWHVHLETLRHGEFERRYRMSETKFKFLLEQCAEHSEFFQECGPEKRRLHRCCYGCDPIDVRHKLGAALRWLAGGSYLDVRLVHGMSREELYACVWQTVDAINASSEMKLEFPWHNDIKLQELERGFAGLCNGKLRGCVFAIDGFCVRIISPSGVLNPRDYWHRKGFYAFVVQAVVDSSGKFRCVSLKAVGSTHDSLAFKMSKFYSMLESGLLCRETGLSGLETYFGMGDDAYACREFLVTPWPGRNLSAAKDNMNYFQSRLRIVVECAFGRLVKRWGCLWSPLQVAYWRVPALVTALMKLHNLCDKPGKVAILRQDLNHFMKTEKLPLVFHNDFKDKGVDLQRRRDRARSGTEKTTDRNHSTRQVLTDHLRNIGAARPPHSRYRVRRYMQIARTKQTTRKVTGDRAQKKSGSTTAGATAAGSTTAGATAAGETADRSGAAAAEPAPTKRRRKPKNYGWTKPGSKASRRASRRRVDAFPDVSTATPVTPVFACPDVSTGTPVTPVFAKIVALDPPPVVRKSKPSGPARRPPPKQLVFTSPEIRE